MSGQHVNKERNRWSLETTINSLAVFASIFLMHFIFQFSFDDVVLWLSLKAKQVFAIIKDCEESKTLPFCQANKFFCPSNMGGGSIHELPGSETNYTILLIVIELVSISAYSL
jgi:hypothetical protein